MSMTESIAYLFIVTIVGFVVILAMYLLHKKIVHKNKINLKTKAEK